MECEKGRERERLNIKTGDILVTKDKVLITFA
jgi:hypothetical protein